MASVNFLVNIYPKSDSFFCECVPGIPGCRKCPIMALCVDCGKILRCAWGIKHES
jgi:hypothetical protein